MKKSSVARNVLTDMPRLVLSSAPEYSAYAGKTNFREYLRGKDNPAPCRRKVHRTKVSTRDPEKLRRHFWELSKSIRHKPYRRLFQLALRRRGGVIPYTTLKRHKYEQWYISHQIGQINSYIASRTKFRFQWPVKTKSGQGIFVDLKHPNVSPKKGGEP